MLKISTEKPKTDNIMKAKTFSPKACYFPTHVYRRALEISIAIAYVLPILLIKRFPRGKSNSVNNDNFTFHFETQNRTILLVNLAIIADLTLKVFHIAYLLYFLLWQPQRVNI